MIKIDYEASSQLFWKSPLLVFNISMFYRVALVVLFPTKLDSPRSEFSCKSYGVSAFGVLVFASWSGSSGVHRPKVLVGHSRDIPVLGPEISGLGNFG